MRVGVLGLGHWGANHVRVLSAARHVESVHVADLDPCRVAAATASARGVVASRGASQLFADVDAVVIATHPSTHVELAVRALRAGCHVLVEKPLALRASEVLAVGSVARQLDRVLMVGHTFVFHPAVQALLAAVRRGEVGAVRHVESRRLNLGIYRSDCDVVWDLGPHDISILNLLLGGPPTSVSATGAELLSSGITDAAHLTLRYEGGVQAAVSLSWRWPTKVRELTLVGSSGMAVFDDTDKAAPLRFHDSTVTLPRQAEAPHSPPFVYRSGAMRVHEVPALEPLAQEDQHFIDCSLTGAEPVTGLQHALDVVRTLQAAEASMARGREVHLSEVDAVPARSSSAELSTRSLA